MKLAKGLILGLLITGGSFLILFHIPDVAHTQGPTAYGEPLSDVTREERDLFFDGKENFEEVEEILDGLGPGFNGRSCAECHSTPATGGASAMTVLRFGRIDKDQFDPLEALGGSLLQLFAIRTECQARVPPEANVIARRITTPLFGVGLVEGIPDDDILAYAEQQTPEMQGRAHLVEDMATKTVRVGRFGWKAQQATLMAFSADAYLNEMGITSSLLPADRAPNGDTALLAECDRVPDPEDRRDPATGLFSIEKFTNFMRYLAPPSRGPVSKESLDGEVLFQALDCAVCHKPSYTTAPHKSDALDQKAVNAYSDFLLHDVGTGDNIQQGQALMTEFRTPPLWGLRARGPYLHDGSAATLEQAILRHAGQAQSSATRFNLLSTSQRLALMAFLNSL